MADVNLDYLLEQFQILEEYLLVDALREASRFRNLVTYQTAVIRDEEVYQILQDHLDDFERFLSLVARWLSAPPVGPG